MPETGGRRLREWLLLSMHDLGGQAPRQAVHAQIASRFGDSLSEADKIPRVGRRGEPAWRNNVDSLYDRMKRVEGTFEPTKRGDAWSLSSSGLAESQVLASDAAAAEPRTGDPLEYFHPKDDSDYIVKSKSQVSNRSRSHETLLREFGDSIWLAGWRPSTHVHPRDLELRRENEICLVEVKVVYAGNSAQATREAVSQLLEYRHYYYPVNRQPSMLAVFSENIGASFENYLDTLVIASVARGEGVWLGNRLAKQLDLVPFAASR